MKNLRPKIAVPFPFAPLIFLATKVAYLLWDNSNIYNIIICQKFSYASNITQKRQKKNYILKEFHCKVDKIFEINE